MLALEVGQSVVRTSKDTYKYIYPVLTVLNKFEGKSYQFISKDYYDTYVLGDGESDLEENLNQVEKVTIRSCVEKGSREITVLGEPFTAEYRVLEPKEILKEIVRLYKEDKVANSSLTADVPVFVTILTDLGSFIQTLGEFELDFRPEFIDFYASCMDMASLMRSYCDSLSRLYAPKVDANSRLYGFLDYFELVEEVEVDDE